MSTRVALGVIVQNEASSILEWVVHHSLLGFDPIYVYDNVSVDRTSLICQYLQECKIIKYIPWPNPEFGTTSPQILSYVDMICRVSADWVCFIDADEFVCLGNHDNIIDFVSSHSGESPIALNWKIYGSSNRQHATPELVIDRFRLRARENLANGLIKTIAPMKICFEEQASVHIHGWVISGDKCHYVDALGRPIEIEDNCKRYPPLWKGAWINHYLIKSREEFDAKRRRGSANAAPEDLGKPRRTFENYFDPYDQNEVYDFHAARYVEAVQWRCRLLREGLERHSVLKSNVIAPPQTGGYNHVVSKSISQLDPLH